MTIKSCMEKAHKNLLAGKITQEHVSFECFRKIELMREKGLDHENAWAQAKRESMGRYQVYLKKK